jgi:hypothetical protein
VQAPADQAVAADIDFHRIICTIEEPWSGGKWASQMGKKPVSFGHPKPIA